MSNAREYRKRKKTTESGRAAALKTQKIHKHVDRTLRAIRLAIQTSGLRSEAEVSHQLNGLLVYLAGRDVDGPVFESLRTLNTVEMVEQVPPPNFAEIYKYMSMQVPD